MIISQLGAFFAGVKAIQYIIVLGTPIQQFDTSTSLLLERFTDQQTINLWWNQRFWNKLLSWDAVYFVKGIINGNPEFEHESAFSPFWSKIVRICCRGNFEFYHVLKTAVILENGLLLLSVFVIYYLTMKTFEENALRSHQRRKLAQKSAMLFILTSATGFFLGIYSEPLSVCLTFLGLLAREVSVSYDVYGNVNCKFMRWPVYTIISTACFAAATTNRPNCVLLGFYYVSDLINLLKTRRFAQAFFMPFVSGVCMLSLFVLHQYYLPYSQFCPQRGEWCLKKIAGLPMSYQSLYSFAQHHYWNVGFMKYWTINNIPNFLFAVPNIVVMWYSTVYFSLQYPCSNLKPIIWTTRAFLLIMVLFAHIQIINRVSSFIPLHLWYIADRLNKMTITKDSAAKGDDRLIKYYVTWLIFWIPVQTTLFASFLPPA